MRILHSVKTTWRDLTDCPELTWFRAWCMPLHGAVHYARARASHEPYLVAMAERVGFEPTSPFGRTAFRERRLKPLGNLSNCPNQIKTIYSSIDPL